MNKALTISAADCTGTVGIQRDIKVFLKSNIETWGITTSIIAQNKMGEFKIEKVSKDILKAQLKAVFEEVDFDVIKIGTVIGEDNIKVLGKALRKKRNIPNIVLNPQIISGKGNSILSEKEKKTLIKEIFPLAYLLILTKRDIEEILNISIYGVRDIEEVLDKLKKLGPVNILIRNLQEETDGIDILYDGEELTYFKGQLLSDNDTYVLGENISAHIASNIGNKLSLKTSIKNSKEYLTEEKIKF